MAKCSVCEFAGLGLAVAGVMALAFVWPAVAAIAVVGVLLWLAPADRHGVTASATQVAIERSRTVIGDLEPAVERAAFGQPSLRQG